jgi:uncharacterized membrane protein YphA (DoxX/SURF4 family)
MNIALWIVQVILAAMFIMAGYTKAFQPLDIAAKRINWIPDVPPGLVRFIGVSELLAGIGLIAPAVTGILPWLTPLAAAGLMLVMLCATIFHISRREYGAVGFVVVLFALAAFVAYGRWALIPFS